MSKRTGPIVLLSAGFFFLLTLVPGSSVFASDQEELAVKRDEVRDSDFFYEAAWETDYRHALARSNHWKVLIFAYFTPSYESLAHCKAIEKDVLTGAEFAEFGKSFSLYCNIFSKVSKDPNQGMIFEKGGADWPYVAVLDGKGRVLAAHDGEYTLDRFKETAEKARKVAAEFDGLEKRAAKGDQQASRALLLARIELGHLPSTEARAGLARIADLGEKERDRLEVLVGNKEYSEVFGAYAKNWIDESKAVTRYQDLQKSGAALPTNQAALFWRFMAEKSMARGEKKVAELAIDLLSSLDIRDAEFKERMKRSVEQLRRGTGN